MDEKEIEKEIISNPEHSKEINNNSIINESIESILNDIFIHKNINNKIEYQPILINSKKIEEKLKLIFNVPDIKIKSNINIFQNFINNKIELLKKIKEIIGNSYEILHIIINYLSKIKICPITYIIDLYFDYIFISSSINTTDELLNNLKSLLNWFFSCGFMNKKYSDYIFQRLSKFQFEQKLTPEIFDLCLSLIEIIYGKDYIFTYKKNLIAKNYIYFYNKESSILNTNISKTNNIYIKDGCSVIMWIYINNDLVKGSKLCEITIEKNKNEITFDFIVNNNFDIDIKSNNKLYSIFLKEQNNKVFKLQKNKWIQLKIQMTKMGIKLNIFQNYEEFGDKNNEYTNDEEELIIKKIKYETKTYQTNNNKCKLDIDLNNYNINDLKFFKNYIGLAGTIIFCKNNNPSETPVNSLYGLKSNKISNFIGEIGLTDVFFIFSPSLYNYEKNKFIYIENNIIGELSLLNTFKEPNTIIDYNNVYKYCNYINNIYKLGGMINILPLFEIFYKFSKNNNNGNNTNRESILNDIFYKLIKIVELIIVKKEKNYLNIIYNNSIFETLQLFLENIDEKYYQKNNDVLLTLLNIGYDVFEFCKQKSSITNIIQDNYYLNSNKYNYFKYILFYPKIVLKFSLEQQNKIWNFFEDIKNTYRNKLKLKINSENYLFNNSYYRKCFLSFEQINNFILLFNEKYPNEFLSQFLISILKNIFFDAATNDQERESLLLLINSDNDNNNRLSDKIIISIIEIFIYYLDTNYKKFILNNTKMPEFLKIDNNKENLFYSPIMSVKSFLSSPNFFIETLLGILSTNNLNVKKVIINLLRIISQKFSDALNTHFINVEIENKKDKKNKKIQRVTKNEFYFFIQENIAPNYMNQNFREIRKLEINDDKNNDIISVDNKKQFNIRRRKATMDSINIIINNIENKNKKNENKVGKNKNNKNKKSKSCEIKDITEIKKKSYQNNDIVSQRRKTDFNLFNNRINNQESLNQIIRVSTDKNLKYNNIMTDIKEEENIKNNNKINENLNQLEIQKTNCEISMILFDWLLTSERQVINKRTSLGNISSYVIFDINSNLSDTIINFILKFLCSNKDLEVIYKLLFITLGQKGFSFTDNNIKNNLMSFNGNYLTLLNYFSSSKTNFMQFLEELMVNSYIFIHYKEAQNKFSFVNEFKTPENKNKNEYFQVIYEKTKELIIDIFFNDININKNNIINELINIVLSLCNGLKNINEFNEKDKIIRNIMLNLLKEFLTDISNIYITKLKEYEKKMNKKSSSKKVLKSKNSENITINDKNDEILSSYENIKHNFIIFIYFIFEYTLLLINSNIYISKILTDDLLKIKNFSDVPDFLKYEIDKNGNKNETSINIDLYLKVYYDIINFFSIENLLKKINSSSQNTNDNKHKIEVIEESLFYFEPLEINKLFKESSINKDLKNILKENLNLLFLSYNDLFKNFPLITIITILNNYYINYFIYSKQNEKIDSSKSFDFICFLNSHMQFILMIILVSCSIKENENYPLKEKTYKDIQEILFTNLLYNINNIIYYFDSQYSITFIEIFTNIMTLISYLWSNDNDHKSLFHLGKDKSKNAVKRVIYYYISKYTYFFNSSNLEILSKQTINKNKELIMIETNNIYINIFKKNNEDKVENLPSEDIFDISKFEYIYNCRQNDINNKIKPLIKENSDKNNFYINDNEKETNIYKSILLKVDTLKMIYDNNDLYNNLLEIEKRKNYRKIKKTLYSWNNSYSIQEVFYKEKFSVPKNDEIILKYKLSNYLSKDMTRKLLVPILDIDYYMPNFKLFNYKEKIFQNIEDNNINQYHNLYKIDLKIFNEQKYISSPKDEQKYIMEIACYIKTTHHIRGKLFFDKNLVPGSDVNDTNNSVSLSPPIQSLFFIESNINDTDYLLKNFDDFDSDNLTCFGSIFRNNINNKDSELFLNFNFNDINFIFLRKYCFRNNSIEIFLTNHRSYYFKFLDDKRRDKFLRELLSILNNNNNKNKLFKPIKGIDEFNKTIIIGYYKHENNNKEYSSISNIRDFWKINEISTLEYLMWINIFGNRSFRDIAQYPVFPWLLTKYDYNTYEELIENPEIRDFNLPMGMLSIDEKSKKRQEGYIETYKMIVTDLIDNNLINIKVKDDEDNSEQNNNNTKNKIIRNSETNTNLINKGITNPVQKIERNQSVLINYQTIHDLIEQTQDKDLPKIPDYKFDIDKFYNNPNFDYEKIPYCFGSHFSNSMYVSHYLVRIFPYSLTGIEIQGDGFDVADRLFLKLQNSIYTGISEKCDLREIIPEFFTLPEMFLNINSLELGKVNLSYLILEDNESNDINNKQNNKTRLNDVFLPKWCKKNPYLFIEKYRKIIESPLININPWIDLMFGCSQRGIKSQKIGNLFLPYVYDGVINSRITKEMLLENRKEKEYMIRLFEMGVHPTKVFEKKNRITKNIPNNTIIEIESLNSETILPEVKIKGISKNKKMIKIIYMNCYSNTNDELMIIDNNFNGQKINIQESKESDKNYLIKENISYKEFFTKNIINKNILNKLIIKSIFKNTFFFLTGYFDGSLYLIKNQNKTSKKEESLKIEDKLYNKINEENIIKIFDKSLITSLEIDKEEKYLIYGTFNGSIVIYSLNYNLYKENKSFIELKKFFKSHNNYPISSISINNDLNLFADCAYDGYVNIYTLSSYSNYRIINSLYIDTSIYNFTLDYIFLSAQPLASVVLYSNMKCQFKCFSINGTNLHSGETDTLSTSNNFNEYNFDSDESMISPIIFTDHMFNDYLIYIFKKNYVFIRQFPLMKIVMVLNPTKNNHNEELSMLCISDDHRYLYIMEEKNNKIYIVNQKVFMANKKETKKSL